MENRARSTTRNRGSQMNRVFLLALCAGAVLVASIVPTPAFAYSDPPVKLGADPQYLPDTAGLIAESSPREIPGIDPSNVAQDWYRQEWDTSAALDLPTSSELHSELAGLVEETGTWDWSLVPEVAVPAAAAGAAGYVGWRIGSKIWGFFNDPPSPTPAQYAYVDHWKVVKPGTLIWSDWTGDVRAPTWGMWAHDNYQYLGRVTNGSTDACTIDLLGEGEPLFAPGWTQLSPFNYCDDATAYRYYALFRGFDIVNCDAVAPCTGISPQSYDGTGQPTVPTAQQLEDRIQSELGTGNYPVANQWLNYLADPENYADPRTRPKQDHRCDRPPGAAYANPDTGSAHGEFDVYDPQPFSVTDRPQGAESTDVFLRYGRTSWIPADDPTADRNIDNWDGWGYRHIKAKHGWSPLDREETQLALDEAPPVPTQGGFSYEAPVDTPGQGGVPCIRHVVVDFFPTGSDPAARGIVTSFNSVG